MDRKQLLKTGAAVGAGALVAAGPAQANDDNSHSAVGSWFGTVTATNPPLGSFNDILSIHDAGVVTESRRYYVVPPPSTGAPIGTDNIRLKLTLDADGQKLTGTFVSQVKDNAGNVLIQVEGTYTADRITV